MEWLDGSAAPVRLGPFELSAPGLQGEAWFAEPPADGLRSGGAHPVSEALDAALAASDADELGEVVLDVRPGGDLDAPGTRSALTGEAGMVLTVPDRGPGYGQIVLSVDEAGVVRWILPQDQAGQIEVSSARGDGARKTFVIPRDPPPPEAVDDAGELASRGVISWFGKKLLKVLVFDLAGRAAGALAVHVAGRWEQRRQPYRVRSLTPDDYGRGDVAPLDADGWRRVLGGRALLFLHGTFSSTLGFQGLERGTVERLAHAYEGRVLALDHPTVTQTPEENAAWLLSQVPPGTSPWELDVVCHSRGGLVARALAGELDVQGAERVAIRRIVHVATPNQGTVLADPANGIRFLDRVSSLLTLAPDGPLDMVATGLEAVIALAQAALEHGLGALPGLQAMNPRAPDGVIARLAASTSTSPPWEGYAIRADFEPPPRLRALLRGAGDAVVDLVFGEDGNDVVVPHEGVAAGCGDPAFPIVGERLLEFTGGDVWHCAFFSRPETNERLLRWLAPREAPVF